MLHKQPQGSSVTVLGVLCHEVLLASGNRCFSQVLRGSGWICVSSVRVKEACPCVLGCCCSCGVHSCFLSFLDNPDRHSMLHFYYKLLHEIMVFMTDLSIEKWRERYGPSPV